MKRNITIFMVCILILTCFFGCAPKQIEPDATIAAPTETVVAPTEEPTEEPPTEAVELTEEEKKQLYYEQMFADGTYVIDWSCVNIDVDTNYHVEQYSDENGIFWEKIHTLEGDPHYLYSMYYRGNEKQFYAVKFTDWKKGGNYYVADSTPRGETIIDSIVNDIRSMTESCLSRQKSLTYEERENEDTIIKIDCGNLDTLMVYIDPITAIINKAYIINYDKLYTIEFVNTTPEEITTFDNLPFTITETVNYDYVTTTNKEIEKEIASHHCPDWVPSRPEEAIVQLQSDGETQAKWEEIFANNAYTLNWDSVKIEMGTAYVAEVLSDKNGIYWDAITTLTKDRHQLYACIYRPDDDNKFYYVEETYEGDISCLTVEMSNADSGYAYSRVVGVRWVYDQIFARQKEVVYKGMLDGAVVVEISCGPIEKLVFHIDPSTYNVRKLYIIHNSRIEDIYYVEFIPDTAPRKTLKLPPTEGEMLSRNEAFDRESAMSTQIATHGCDLGWALEERIRGIESAE